MFADVCDCVSAGSCRLAACAPHIPINNAIRMRLERERAMHMTVRSLKQNDKPLRASLSAVRRLVGAVAVGGAETAIRVMNQNHALHIDMWPLNDAANEASAWETDMRSLFRGLYTFEHDAESAMSYRREETAQSAQYPYMVEVVSANHDLDANDAWSEPESFQLGSRLPDDWWKQLARWPQIGAYNIDEFYKALLEVPGAGMLFLLGRASSVERNVALEALGRSWMSSPDDFSSYSEHCVRFRALMFADVEVPNALQSEYGLLCPNVGFRVLSESESRSLSNPSPNAIAGCVQPSGAVEAMLRLPVAELKPFPGMSTIKPVVGVRPLDPMPAEPTELPITLGQASLPDGRRCPMTMSVKDLATHMHVLGQTGSGKTTFLVNLAHELRRQNVGFAVLSPHEDLMDRVLADPVTDEEPMATDHMLAIDYGDESHVVPMNPLAEHDDNRFAMKVSAITVALKQYIDPTSQGMFGERASSAFSLVASACRTLGMASIPMVTSILSRQDLCRTLVGILKERDGTLARRIHQELAGLQGIDATDLFSWMGSRFQMIHSSPVLMNILGTRSTALDVVKVMDEGMQLVVNLGASAMGGEASRFLLALWLIEFQNAMLRRKHPHQPFVLIIDEAHAAAMGPLAAILDEGRKFGLYVVVAHQRLGQLRSGLADALESDSGSFISLRSGVRDAMRAGVRLNGWPAEELARLPRFEAAAVIVRDGVPTEPFTLHIDPPRVMEDGSLRAANGKPKPNWRTAVLNAANAEIRTMAILGASQRQLSDPYAREVVACPDTVERILSMVVGQ